MKKIYNLRGGCGVEKIVVGWRGRRRLANLHRSGLKITPQTAQRSGLRTAGERGGGLRKLRKASGILRICLRYDLGFAIGGEIKKKFPKRAKGPGRRKEEGSSSVSFFWNCGAPSRKSGRETEALLYADYLEESNTRINRGDIGERGLQKQKEDSTTPPYRFK